MKCMPLYVTPTPSFAFLQSVTIAWRTYDIVVWT